MSDFLLTIAIPTYNRPDKVLNTIKNLLSQINGETCIVVLDNCSATNIKQHIYQNIDTVYHNKIRIERNFINLGADANFMRCFEYCETPYIWLLADDGFIEPEAIKMIFFELDNYKESNIVGINFGSNYTNRTETVIANGIDDFINKIDNFENFLLLSSTVYRCTEYIENIRYGYWGAYSMASQIIPCLVALGNGKSLVISKYPIVVNILGDRTEKWPDAQQALALSSILEAPLGLTGLQYKEFGKFLFKSIETFPRVFCDIILGVNFDVNKIDSYHKYIYKKIYKNTIEFRQSKLKQYILYKVYYFLLICKPLLKLILKSTLMKTYVLASSRFIIFKR